MKKRISFMILSAVMVLGCVMGNASLASAAGNVQNRKFTFNSYVGMARTDWEDKKDTTKVYVYPQKGQPIYYTVGGLKDGESYQCSQKFKLPMETECSITNTVREAGCTKARLRFDAITEKKNVTTSGLWSPDSTKNYTVY
ncbi:MAG: hypothetical protein NC347_04500 [Clostridium sp.]|nr:hypothetical protein [Clostridium sp.]